MLVSTLIPHHHVLNHFPDRIFGSKKEAQFALTSIQSGVKDPDIHVEEYCPAAGDACFTRLRVTGIPESGTIADVAKWTPRATSITIRPATDTQSEKVAVVSFSGEQECKETFIGTEAAEIQGKRVCVFFERKRHVTENSKLPDTTVGSKKVKERRIRKRGRFMS